MNPAVLQELLLTAHASLIFRCTLHGYCCVVRVTALKNL